MNDLFQVLSRAMRDKESLRIQITRDGIALKVLVQPLLGEEPDDLDHDEPNEAAQVRAALALPLSLHMDPKTLDEQFGKKITLFGDARAPLHDSFEILMENLKEADKVGKNAVSKHGHTGKTASPPKPVGKKKAVGESAKNDDENDQTDEVDDSVTEVATPAAVIKPVTATIF